MIVSVGFVSAEDVNQTGIDDLQVSEENVLPDVDAKSFADLNDTISKSGNVVNLTDNYEYKDGDGYYVEVTIDEGDTLTINGNNHVIEGNNKAGVFKFINGTVFINNLTFKNCGDIPILFMNELTTNNVIFENNSNNDYAGAVFAYQSNYYSNNDRFIDNYAPEGSAIYSVDSIVNVDSLNIFSIFSIRINYRYFFNFKRVLGI